MLDRLPTETSLLCDIARLDVPAPQAFKGQRAHALSQACSSRTSGKQVCWGAWAFQCSPDFRRRSSSSSINRWISSRDDDFKTSVTIALARCSMNAAKSGGSGMITPVEETGVACSLSPVTVWDHAAMSSFTLLNGWRLLGSVPLIQIVVTK